MELLDSISESLTIDSVNLVSMTIVLSTKSLSNEQFWSLESDMKALHIEQSIYLPPNILTLALEVIP